MFNLIKLLPRFIPMKPLKLFRQASVFSPGWQKLSVCWWHAEQIWTFHEIYLQLREFCNYCEEQMIWYECLYNKHQVSEPHYEFSFFKFIHPSFVTARLVQGCGRLKPIPAVIRRETRSRSGLQSGSGTTQRDIHTDHHSHLVNYWPFTPS